MNRNTIGYGVMVVVMIVVGAVSLRHFFITRTDADILDINTFPMTVGGWQGTGIEVTEKEYEILETRNLIVRDYVNTVTNKSVNLFIIYSETNRSVFHPPEVCLVGDGAEITAKKAAKVGDGENGFFINELCLERNNSKMVALYCYTAGDLYTDNFYLQQAHFAFNQMFARRRGGATIRVTMQVDGSQEEALSTLREFLVEAVVEFKRL